MRRWLISTLLLTACGGPELTVMLEAAPGLDETVVWFRPMVQRFQVETPEMYPAQRVGDGSVRIPFPEDGEAFSLRIDACAEGEGCEASRRMAVACSRVMTITAGEQQPPIKLTLIPVPSPDPGGCP